MRKYLFFVPIVLFVVMISGCIDSSDSSNSNNTFNQSGVSFTYPGDWSQLTSDEAKNISLNPSNVVGGVESEDQSLRIGVHKFSADGMSIDDLETSMAETYADNNISEISAVTIDGNDALVATYSDDSSKTKIIVILSGDYYYSIEMQTFKEDYADKESIMNSIMNSIQIS